MASQSVGALVREHVSSRAAFIAKEKERRHDFGYRQRMSPLAVEAANVVRDIREKEKTKVWSKAPESEEEVYPGMAFTLAKDRMEKTLLWKVVKQMPKGALLHCHFDAMCDMRWMCEAAIETPNILVSVPQPLLKPEDYATAAAPSFQIGEASADLTPITSASYKADTLVPLSSQITDANREDFINYFVRHTTISIEDSLTHHHGLHDIWRRFSAVFRVILGISQYVPFFRKMVRRVISQLAADGVRYVDIRTVFFVPENAEDRNKGAYDILTAFREELEAFKATPEGKNFWGARIIWTTLRMHGRDFIEENMRYCVEVYKKFPDIIAGFDLVGQEDLGRPLLDLIPELKYFESLCAQEKVTIPFFFHAGEVNSDGDVHDENLFDAILLGTKRIGHGFSLYKHPLLIEEVRNRNICLEVCPISNEVLRLASSILSHPLPAFMANGVAVALANDDPGILGQGATGMSHDFYQVLQAYDNVGLEGVGDLVETSVLFAAFEGEEVGVVKEGGYREKCLNELRAEWEAFCKWIVDEVKPLAAQL
ncbi:hypothetical protein H072_4635 [Dactylellina haptotyla CBS 200.50]|uniref:adenosine deaminase n=1 Tax=Dactylellina haptotyla (strain CBS 200.50) TaxID=1284197 RepID=S8AF04_DACHA|nr:hypothetical protein H072_4635 [Dactylellina haptotyla CBS 200.50]